MSFNDEGKYGCWTACSRTATVPSVTRGTLKFLSSL